MYVLEIKSIDIGYNFKGLFYIGLRGYLLHFFFNYFDKKQTQLTDYLMAITVPFYNMYIIFKYDFFKKGRQT